MFLNIVLATFACLSVVYTSAPAVDSTVTIVTFSTETELTHKIRIPSFAFEVHALRAFVRDKRFVTILSTKGNLFAVDMLYLKALQLADYNIARALALCLLSVLDHRTLRFKIPLISALEFPLTFESDSLFKKRLNHLQKNLYSSSPKTETGDKDKLQHFFASAYLSYTSETLDLVPIIGVVIEYLEEAFIYDGSYDKRDIIANEQGNLFGRSLLNDISSLPSQYLILQTEARK